jgi:predicted transcriptional regulator
VSSPHGRADDLEALFGPLEARVLEALWTLNAPAAVRDLQPMFSGTAYTTLMTTLDRLHRKGVLARDKAGRAFVYRQRWTRRDLVARMAGEQLGAIIAPDPALQPLVSFFVDAVTRRDEEVLGELERLVARRRADSDKEETP